MAMWLEYVVCNAAGCGKSARAGETSRRQTGTHANVKIATIATVRSREGRNAPVHSDALRMGASIAKRTAVGNVRLEASAAVYSWRKASIGSRLAARMAG